jgi:hypothetical protein
MDPRIGSMSEVPERVDGQAQVENIGIFVAFVAFNVRDRVRFLDGFFPDLGIIISVGLSHLFVPDEAIPGVVDLA